MTEEVIDSGANIQGLRRAELRDGGTSPKQKVPVCDDLYRMRALDADDEDVVNTDLVKNMEAVQKVSRGPLTPRRMELTESEPHVSDFSAEDEEERSAPDGGSEDASWRPRFGPRRGTGDTGQRGATRLGRGRRGPRRGRALPASPAARRMQFRDFEKHLFAGCLRAAPWPIGLFSMNDDGVAKIQGDGWKWRG